MSKFEDSLPVKERISNNSEKLTESGCWIWMNSLDGSGYGQISTNSKIKRAHRVSYSEFIRDIPEGMLVLHRCDTPSCVNPSHLFLGTHQDNMRDKAEKGRASRMGAPKLNEDDVRYIRSSSAKNITLAKKFNVTHQAISAIKHRRVWRNI